MVSDAFFPFRDGVDVAIKEGIRAIVHPGGSLRDFESIEACNEANPQVTMVFTGQRAFKELLISDSDRDFSSLEHIPSS